MVFLEHWAFLSSDLLSIVRFGVSQTSEESSRSNMENGGRERDHGSGSDEDEDCEQNTSETGQLENHLVKTQSLRIASLT